HDAQRDRAICRRSDDGASDNPGTGKDKQDRRERMSRRTVDSGTQSDLPPAHNEERRCRHSEKDEINSYFEIQDLSICSRAGDYRRCQTLQDNRSYRRSRPSREFADALKEKPVAGHRVVHAGSRQHALAEESEGRNCDASGNPLRAPVAQRDPHHIGSWSRCCIETDWAEPAQTCKIDCKIKSEITAPTPISNPHDKSRRASRISPATKVAVCHPPYAKAMGTMAAPILFRRPNKT